MRRYLGTVQSMVSLKKQKRPEEARSMAWKNNSCSLAVEQWLMLIPGDIE